VDVEPKPRKRAQQQRFAASSETNSPARGRSVDAEDRSRRPCRQRKELISRNFLKPSDGLEPSTPSLPSRQLVATHGNGFGLILPVSGAGICDRLPAVANTGLHKGSTFRCLIWRRLVCLRHDPPPRSRTERGPRRLAGLGRYQWRPQSAESRGRHRRRRRVRPHRVAPQCNRRMLRCRGRPDLRTPRRKSRRGQTAASNMELRMRFA
jgi:hypothetical protein